MLEISFEWLEKRSKEEGRPVYVILDEIVNEELKKNLEKSLEVIKE